MINAPDKDMIAPHVSTSWTLQTLHDTACAEIPEQPGLYFIYVPQSMSIRFQPTADNHHAPFYDVAVLQEKYHNCGNPAVLYIGKASGKKGLRQRLRQYMKYGWNEAVNHKGGRAIWQVEHAKCLLLTCQVCPDADAREHQLLKEFRQKYRTLPLANWKT